MNSTTSLSPRISGNITWAMSLWEGDWYIYSLVLRSRSIRKFVILFKNCLKWLIEMQANRFLMHAGTFLLYPQSHLRLFLCISAASFRAFDLFPKLARSSRTNHRLENKLGHLNSVTCGLLHKQHLLEKFYKTDTYMVRVIFLLWPSPFRKTFKKH